MNAYRPLLIAALASCGFAVAAPVYTNPAGYVSITCPANSDTIVGLPLRMTSAYSGALSANPVSASGSATLTLAGSPAFTANEFAGAYYVKFKDTTPTAAAGDGQWFSITANTTNTITVDLNGGTIAAVSGAQLEVLKFWTLAELFPPADCTTDPATTGTAIVASTNLFPGGRGTEILYPNLTASGINISAAAIYFVHNGNGWRKQSSGATDFGNTQLWPDTYFIIRNPSTLTSATTYTVSGEVEMNSFVLPLSTLASGQQDNFIGMPRAVDVTLNQLNLANSSAFVSSTSLFPGGRKDELIVFDNAVVGKNKSASAIYFHLSGNGWRKQSSGATDFGNAVIPAGCGFIIRKATGDGNTKFWFNSSSY